MNSEQENILLRERITALENQLDNYRLSRRVLMNLIEKIEHEKNFYIAQLEKENKRLLLNNKKYARDIMKSNLKINELSQRGFDNGG